MEPVSMVVIGLALIVCAYMAWNIGANDVANAMGTSVGSKALTLKQAVIIAAIFEFAGAFFAGDAVTDTVRKGILEVDFSTVTPDISQDIAFGFIAAMMAAAVFVASLLGVNEDLNTAGIWTIFGFAILGLGVTSEGVIDNIWRYAAIIAGLFGIVGAGSEFITGNDIFGDSPLQIVAFLTFIAGVGVGPLLAWRKKE